MGIGDRENWEDIGEGIEVSTEKGIGEDNERKGGRGLRL